jgi:hypothetical protein
LEGNDAGASADAEAEKIGLFGTIVLFPVNWKPGRWGLAGTLFEILSFEPGFIRTQVLAWGLARKASKTFPILGNCGRKIRLNLNGRSILDELLGGIKSRRAVERELWIKSLACFLVWP